MDNNFTDHYIGEQVTVHDMDGHFIIGGIITKVGNFHASVVDTEGTEHDVAYGMIRRAAMPKTAEHEVIREEEQEGKKFVLSKSEKNVDGSIAVAYEVTVDGKLVWKSEEVVTNVYDFENGWSAPDDFDENKLELIQQTAESGFDMVIQSYENVVDLVREEIAPETGEAGLPESAPKGKPAFSPDAPQLEAEQGGEGGMGGGGEMGVMIPPEGAEGAEGEEVLEPSVEAAEPGAGGVAPFAEAPAEETATAASLQRPSLARSVLSSKMTYPKKSALDRINEKLDNLK